MSINDDLEKLLKQAGEPNSNQDYVSQEFEKIKQRIRRGEKTKDKIKDFSIVAGLPDIQEIYCRNLSEMINNSQGEPVLFLREDEQFYYPGSRPPMKAERRFIKINKRIRVGVISGTADFDIKKAEILLPVKKHAMLLYPGTHWEIINRPIRLELVDVYHLGRGMLSGSTMTWEGVAHSLQYSSDVFVSRQARDYFARMPNGQETFDEGLRLLEESRHEGLLSRLHAYVDKIGKSFGLDK